MYCDDKAVYLREGWTPIYISLFKGFILKNTFLFSFVIVSHLLNAIQSLQKNVIQAVKKPTI